MFEFSQAALTGNDNDPDGDPVTIIDITGPLRETVELVGTSVDGDPYWYTPNPEFNGSETMTCTVSVGTGGTDTATLTMEVTALNDAPSSTASARRCWWRRTSTPRSFPRT